MGKTTPAGVETMFYSCPKCGVYFEAYSQAFRHLKLKHHLKIKSVESVTFQRCNIPIERLKEGNRNNNVHNHADHLCPSSKEGTCKSVAPADPSNPKKEPNKRNKDLNNAAIKKKGGGRVEIKLDNLKASEIETLMEDLFQTQSGTRPRRTRKVLETSTNTEEDHDFRFEGPSSPSSSALEETRKKKKKRTSSESDLDYEEETVENSEDNEDSDEEEHKDKNGNDKDTQDSDTIKIGAHYRYFPCRLCPETFKIQHKFMNHMTTNHLKNGVYTCPKEGCGRTFPTIRRFNKHPHIAIKEGQYLECPKCGGKYRGTGGLKKHLKKHENGKTKPPPKPPKPKFVHPEKTYKCPVPTCPKSFDIVERLRRHFVLHLENNPFVCKMSGCGRKFSSGRKLKIHIQLHIGEKRYKCDKCDFAYVQKYSLVRHIKEFHEADRGHIKRSCTTQRPRIKRVDTEVDFTTGDSTIAKNGNPNTSNGVIKEEEEEEFLRIEVGSQHLDDTNWEFGETTPTTTTDKDSDTESDEEDDEESQETLGDGPTITLVSPSLKSIISKDPVYKKLLAENPNVAALLLPTKGDMHTIDYAKVFKCSLCDWETVQRHHLGLHMKKVHDQVLDGIDDIDSQKPIDIDKASRDHQDQAITAPSTSSIKLLCGKCGHSSTSPDELTAHMNKEHPEKMPYPCTHCTMRFKYSKTLKTHEKTVHFPEKNPVDPEKKHACPHCPAQYSLRGSLNAHIGRNHSSKIMCKLCKKELSKLAFQQHLKRCNKTSRVTCKLCGQTAADKYSLRRHIKAVHLGVKNPDCAEKLKPTISMCEEHTPQEENGNQDLSQESQSDKDNNQILGL